MASKDSLNGKPKNAIAFSGYVNTIYNYDLVGTTSQYPALNIVSIPVGNVLKEPSVSFVIFQTRMRFKSEHQTKIGAVKIYVEGDFINSANAFRIRHALISLNKWDFGQTWSNFADEDAWPNMTDYDGPPTGIWPRPTMIRYNAIRGINNSLSFSVEGPSLEYEENHQIDSIVSTANQDIPDFTVRYRYQSEKFHFQASAVARSIKYKNVLDSSFRYEFGYGISLSTGITMFKRDRLHAQGTIGKGISRYLVGFEGYNWDAVPTGNGDIELVPAMGGFLGYDHYWDKAKKFSSTAVFGYIKIQNDALPIFPGDFMTGYWGLVNFYYHPINNLDFAIEYVTASRKDALNQTGTGGRFQFLVQYAF
jgi:hypothetical protein